MTSVPIYPPHVLHSRTATSNTSAHTFLSNFLIAANQDPAWRPDSTLDQRGPQPVSSEANPNLTLHQLSRIKQALEGKHFGADAHEITRLASQSAERREKGKSKKRSGDGNVIDRPSKGADSGKTTTPKVRSTLEEPDIDTVLANQENAPAASDWQDRAAFELAQDDADVDTAYDQRNPGEPSREEEAMGPDVLEADTGRVIDITKGHYDDERGAEGPTTPSRKLTDRERQARKEAKKASAKEEKRARERARKEAAVTSPVSAVIDIKEDIGPPNLVPEVPDAEVRSRRREGKKAKRKSTKEVENVEAIEEPELQPELEPEPGPEPERRKKKKKRRSEMEID